MFPQANLRQNEAILFGTVEFINGTTNGHDLFGYARVKKGNPGTLVVVNLVTIFFLLFGHQNYFIE
jgi:hypothetical protein